MKKYILIFTSILLMNALSACNRPIAEPEELDPIYKDLVQTLQKEQSKLAEQEKLQADAREGLAKAETGSIQAKILKKDYSLATQNIQKIKQRVKYLEIRVERRKFTDRMTYKHSFEAKKEWPDPNEYSEYLVNKRLNEASRHWSDRVPRLNDRYPSSKLEPKTESEGAEAPAASH